MIDQQTIQQVRAALTRDGRILAQRSDINVLAGDGHITLEGTAGSVAAKRLAHRLAGEAAGGEPIDDRLRVAVADHLGDLEIAQHVRRAFLQERNIEEQQIDIEVDAAGGVTLHGHVHSLAQYRLCEVLCWWGRGVTAVDNRLRVEPPEQDNDEELRDNLLVILEKDVLVNPSKFRLEVRDGIVTLRGRVDSPLEKDAAEKDCWYTPGVQDVINLLEVG